MVILLRKESRKSKKAGLVGFHLEDELTQPIRTHDSGGNSYGWSC